MAILRRLYDCDNYGGESIVKILFVTTIGSTMGFFRFIVKQLIDAGNIVDIATNETQSLVQSYYKEWGCKIFPISTSRSPFSTGNKKAIKQIRDLSKNYDIVHCHTPVAAAVTRLACKNLRNNGLIVIYTAHGFHFYKGAPLKNWIIYYPIEKYCSKFTDILVTINKDDYTFAMKKMKAKQVEYVPGVGIDIGMFSNVVINKTAKLDEIGVPQNATVLLSVGELNSNKNHQIVIKALAQLHNVNLHYVIAGAGGKKNDLEKLAYNLGVSKQVHLLGYRRDVVELYSVADLYLLPSQREGLNVSIMEAMASGLPCIVSKIRGNADMIDEQGGILCDSMNVDAWSKAIEITINGDKKPIEHNIEKSKNYSYENINKKMMELYCTCK